MITTNHICVKNFPDNRYTWIQLNCRFIDPKYCHSEYGAPAINHFGGTRGHWFPYDKSQHNYRNRKDLPLPK